MEERKKALSVYGSRIHSSLGQPESQNIRRDPVTFKTAALKSKNQRVFFSFNYEVEEEAGANDLNRLPGRHFSTRLSLS